jgi:uncharacterized protein YegP (UPF0339 family)
MTHLKSKKALVQVYKRGKNWRWRMKDARNGKIIGASSEGYRRKVDCLNNLDRVINTGRTALAGAHIGHLFRRDKTEIVTEHTGEPRFTVTR